MLQPQSGMLTFGSGYSRTVQVQRQKWTLVRSLWADFRVIFENETFISVEGAGTAKSRELDFVFVLGMIHHDRWESFELSRTIRTQIFQTTPIITSQHGF
jgi:hypothetical protein